MRFTVLGMVSLQMIAMVDVMIIKAEKQTQTFKILTYLITDKILSS
jgi:hypothetical protein